MSYELSTFASGQDKGLFVARQRTEKHLWEQRGQPVDAHGFRTAALSGAQEIGSSEAVCAVTGLG